MVMASLLIGLLAVPAVAASQTRVVDDDGVQCPNAGYSSIQDAINASHSGDTVKVCAGHYTEQLTINKSIKVRAIKRWRAHIYSPGFGSLNPTGSLFAGVSITANNAVFRGFRMHVDGGEAVNTGRPGVIACTHLDAAIFVLAQNVRVRGNKIDSFGEPLYSPCGYDYGILIGHNPETVGRPSGISAGVAGVARVTFNWVTDFNLGGILVEHPDSYAYIRRNTVRFLHTYVASTPCVLTGCVAVRPTGQALTAFGIGVGPAARADIIRNAVYSGANACPLQDICPPSSTPSLDVGIAFAQVSTDTSTVVVHNSVYRNQIGIAALNGSNGAEISYNRVTKGRVGLFIAGAEHSVHHNRAKANFIGIDGGDSEESSFEDNNASGNTEWDCVDDSNGSESFDTANVWVRNIGPNDDPDGICSYGEI